MRKSKGQTTRDVVNHGAGKGDKTRVTDVKAYRENYDAISWGRKPTFKEIIRLGKKMSEELSREIEEENEYEFRHGL